jgi:predicted DNA-binding transcriptional regulator YafY
VSRTARLFRLIDAFRAHRRPVTAHRLAEELDVSVRTIYRDVKTLIELGAPIEGEAGLGYLLRSGFFLPPLMFSPDELESLVLGARWVQEQGDPALAQAAEKALAKIATASPKDLRDTMADTQLWAPRFYKNPAGINVLKPIREAIRREHKIAITYVDEHSAATERVIWPIALAFLEGKRIVAAWCELRSGFRHFRADRISAYQPMTLKYPQRRYALLKAWRQAMHIPEQTT